MITAMLRVFGSESAFEVQQTKLARKGLHPERILISGRFGGDLHASNIS
jgi:hypothetical protein